MAKDVLLQVWMDPEDKRKAEELYRNLGTSLEEAVRIFARQSINDNGMPFRMALSKGEGTSEKAETAMENKADDGALPVKKVIARESDSPEMEESFISGSYGGFSAEMAIEEALAKKHETEE